ncbi:hypothetical protein A3715_17015 [Oleiphilus sp. HI0009]|nr:hypothetical protein A3715_17015 [Oleiphilus sp. HI0009]
MLTIGILCLNKKDLAVAEEEIMAKQNPVAKHCRSFNKSRVYKDRKKDSKKGYSKHKNLHKLEVFCFLRSIIK